MQQSHPSVKHWDDITGGTGMTEEGGAAVLDEKAGSQWALLHRYL
ncbi:hypothetical protein [Wolbachia endosymbiont (group A) of Philonthus cognatus]|nr:hypothetical protein [Wolbachia endosymbiont (group A) of Philonthus cognatus]